MKFEYDLFFVSVLDNKVVGTIMAGYDGHRGWIYSMAVDPDVGRKGIGSALLEHAEKVLRKLGCPKINLQIMPDNSEVVEFYEKNGFKVEEKLTLDTSSYPPGLYIAVLRNERKIIAKGKFVVER